MKEGQCDPLLHHSAVEGSGGFAVPAGGLFPPNRVREEEGAYRHLLLGGVTLMLSVQVHSDLGPTPVDLQVTAY